jgi:selenocysteine lyase/cysteine desulfurase
VFRVPQYKFFGLHAGALYGRYELLDELQAYKVRPADDVPPHKFETGTKNTKGWRAQQRPSTTGRSGGLGGH